MNTHLQMKIHWFNKIRKDDIKDVYLLPEWVKSRARAHPLVYIHSEYHHFHWVRVFVKIYNKRVYSCGKANQTRPKRNHVKSILQSLKSSNIVSFKHSLAAFSSFCLFYRFDCVYMYMCTCMYRVCMTLSMRMWGLHVCYTIRV